MNHSLKRLLLAAFAVFAFSGLARAQIPAPQGRVNDFAGVISADYKDKIGSLIDEVEQKTSAEIAVVTRESIAPYGADAYAQMLFDNWKLGKKGRDNGVLILLAVKEREWRIHTGYGVEGILPDGVCGQIGRDYMVPYFKEGKYSEGLYYGAAAV
ncbi:MAG: TPM domain-containing protein, partial [Candidatus Omnitrophica bacterium]|nr:TPM domain-containing protein [Candidatus Omnitrophota bacterium]